MKYHSDFNEFPLNKVCDRFQYISYKEGKIMRSIKIFLINALTLFFILDSSAQENIGKIELSFEEKLLSVIPDGFDQVSNYRFSPDFKKIAYKVSKSGRGAYIVSKTGVEHIVIGDIKGEEFDYVGVPVFSPDYKLVAYRARKGEKYFVVGDKKSEEFDYVGDPVFGRERGQLAYAANIGGKITWTPSLFGRNPTADYGILSGGKWFIVSGDIRGTEFDFVGDPVLSPDGKLIAYKAFEGENIGYVLNYNEKIYKSFTPKGKWFIVVGDNKGEAFDAVGTPVFSPDGKQIAYAANKEQKWFVLVGNTKGEEFDRVIGDPIFSPDSKQVDMWQT